MKGRRRNPTFMEYGRLRRTYNETPINFPPLARYYQVGESTS